MFKYEEDYQKVEEARRQRPDAPTNALLKDLGVSSASYYAGKRHAAGLPPFGPLGDRKRGGQPKYARIEPAPPPPRPAPVPAPARAAVPRTDGQMIFLKGTPEQINALLAGSLL